MGACALESAALGARLDRTGEGGNRLENPCELAREILTFTWEAIVRR